MVRRGFLVHHAAEEVTLILHVKLVVIEQSLEARARLLGKRIPGGFGGLELRLGLPDGQRPLKTVTFGSQFDLVMGDGFAAGAKGHSNQEQATRQHRQRRTETLGRLEAAVHRVTLAQLALHEAWLNSVSTSIVCSEETRVDDRRDRHHCLSKTKISQHLEIARLFWQLSCSAP